MVQELKFEDYEPDVQQYLLNEIDCSYVDMKKGQVYTNNQGLTYTVLHDSPSGNVSVFVRQLIENGFTDRWVSKAILCS